MTLAAYARSRFLTLAEALNEAEERGLNIRSGARENLTAAQAKQLDPATVVVVC
jgi:hypothetical protein